MIDIDDLEKKIHNADIRNGAELRSLLIDALGELRSLRPLRPADVGGQPDLIDIRGTADTAPAVTPKLVPMAWDHDANTDDIVSRPTGDDDR